MLSKAKAIARESKTPFHIGNVFATDSFYNKEEPNAWKKWARLGTLGVDMETAELYYLAKRDNFQALSILTVCNNLITKEELSQEEREKYYSRMTHLGLEIFDQI